MASDYLIEPTNVPRFFVGSLGLVIISLFVFFDSISIKLPSVGLSVLLVLFYLVSVSGMISVFNTADALFEAQKIFIGVSFLFVFYTISKSVNGLKAMRNWFFVCTVLVLIITAYDFYIFKTNINNVFQPSIFGHKNLLSSFLFLCLPFVIDYTQCRCGKTKYIPLLVVTVLFVSLFLLKTRSVLLAVFIATSVYILLSWSFSWRSKTRKIVFSILTAVILFGAGFGMKYVNKVDHLIGSNNSTASFSERLALWDKTTGLIKEYPIFGVGTGNWQYHYAKFSVNDIEKARFYNTFFKRPHNDYLWVLSENGIIGFVLVFAIFVLLFWFGLRHVFLEKDKKKLLYFSAFIGLMVISFFSFPKERMMHIFLTAAIMAIMIKDVPFFANREVNLKRIWLIPVIAILLLNLLIGFKRMYGEYYTKKAIACQNNLDGKGAIENGLKAISFFYTNDPSCTPVITYAGWGYNQKTDLTNLLSANESAYLLSPYDYKVLSNYAYALLRAGSLNGAKQILLEAYRINANYESTLLNLSVVDFNLQNYEDALMWLQKIEDYEDKYPESVQRITERLNN